MALPSFAPARTRAGTHGYALLVVMVGAIVLAALSAALLKSTATDRSDGRVQLRTVRALYAAEAAVAVGVEEVRTRLDTDTNPSLSGILPPEMPGVVWDEFTVTYVNPNDNFRTAPACTTDAECAGTVDGVCSPDHVCRYSFEVTLTEGPYRNLDAMQTPIQVLATADFAGARATIADVVRLNLVPVFQFALFFDGDLIFQDPAPMTIEGPTHTNGGAYLKGSNAGSKLEFLSPITAAGYQQVCLLSASGYCVDGGADVEVLGRPVTLGRWSHADDDLHRASLEANHPDGIFDKTRNIEELTLPINVPATWDVDVKSRPDVCNANPYVAGEQSAAVALVKRPSSSGYSEYVAPYSSVAGSGYQVVYGPSPTEDVTQARLHASVTGVPDCAGSDSAAAHCQQIARSVPRMSQTQSGDDPDVRTERMYWKAHLRIIDGIWYGKNGNVIFDPETWSIQGAASTADATFRRGLKYARVTRYSWFWDPRENRVYTAGNRFQRGEQIRTTDFDVYAFRQLLKDPDAVSEVFGAGGIPTSGLIVYVSETYDPSFTDANATDASDGWLNRASNVRNYLNFHTMENNAAAADRCFESGQMIEATRDANKPPCAVGWHPYWIWGEGALALTGDDDLVSLTPEPADLANPSRTNLRDDAGYRCRVPIGNTGYVEIPDYTATPKAPCVEAGATPTGPENAVRLVRATRMPEDSGNRPIGFTFVTDNRLYVYGDVNATSPTAAQLGGRVALMADSITLLSQQFSDRVYQRGAAFSGTPQWEDTPSMYGYDGQPSSSLPHYTGGNPTGYSNGYAPNLCLAWRSISGFRPRRPKVDLAIHASLLMGDVPSCPGTGTDSTLGDSSGGVNNFPRFLEDWQATRRVRIRGSMVNLFRAEQGNSRFPSTSWEDDPDAADWTPARTPGAWSWADERSCVYTPPSRDWRFDTELEDPAALPPGTPRLITVDRVRWLRR